MLSSLKHDLARLQRALRTVVTGPQALAFLPALALAAFWLGGETWLLACAIGLPVLFALAGGFARPFSLSGTSGPAAKGISAMLEQALQNTLWQAVHSGRNTACFMLAVDNLADIKDRYGAAATEAMLQTIVSRIPGALREEDRIFRQQDGSFVVVLAPMRHLDLETALQIAARLQVVVEDPLSLDAATVFLSCSIGFCLGARNPGAGGADLLDATQAAFQDARQNGPSAIRAYSDRMRRYRDHRNMQADEAAAALESGQIVPWFQPQISTDTGQITGFEALARWQHPDRGLLPPSEFLPVLEQSDQLERLGEVMLYQALTALRAWDMAGLDIPRVSVNFATQELHNPKLVDKLRWELDRFGLLPSRLAVEILETVVAAAPDDIISRNINGLAKLGCFIDLDDFGTGHASLASMQRFAVSRIKIDRSFIIKVDHDPAQQRMVNAILSMAEKLDLDTLAEGVETPDEHAMLAQLGCRHVQGFGIARPMPFAQTIDWVHNHNAKLQSAPLIRKNAD
ncbi:MAG: putative bifunctional diguanylate cyclase/phosphodiesterase [Paracoccaceae bacterium]|uniref:putative bifunctional diguanylate cyclase/phosphodiesterase n=1 Tax=Seohaeicola saemankumensis TaxID=481181 RepID=UPI003AF367B9